MKIGIIAEGSYPYVRGGVSSWIHTIISNLPEHQFEIIAISDREKQESERKFTFPSNVSGMTDLALTHTTPKRKKPTRLGKNEIDPLHAWFRFQPAENALALIGDDERCGTIDGFFESKFFWDLVQEAYNDEYPSASFIEYFWMWRSMYTPVISLLQNELPKVNVVHSVSTGYAGLLAAYMKQTQGVPMVLTEHGIYAREREEEILQASWVSPLYKKRWIAFFYHLAQQAYQEADDIITLFERNASYQSEAGAPKKKMKIIANGIDYHAYSRIEAEPDSDIFTIGMIARIVPIKDIKTMLYAAKIMQDEGIPFELTIMGPTDESEDYYLECIQLIDSLGIGERVFLVGNVDIASFLPSFDILVLSSISEGQPLSVLEGMAAGLPWVVTDVGACSELIYGTNDDVFGPAGWVVPPVNAALLAEKCRWLYEHPSEAKRFGANGRRRVAAYYQTKKMIDSYRALYAQRGKQYGRDRLSPAKPI